MSGNQDINPFEETKAPAPLPQQGKGAEDPFAPTAATEAPAQPVFYDGPSGATSSQPPVAYNPAHNPGYSTEPHHREESAQSTIHPQSDQQPPENDVPPARELQTSKFWTFKFYQQFFDVDTRDVLRRISNTFVPMSPPDFLLHRNWHANSTQQGVPVETSVDTGAGSTERSPDIYGPFWLCTTLWIIIAIVGNIMSKIAHSHQVRSGKDVAKHWSYDFSVASIAAMTIYCYWGLMSLLVFGLMKWKNLPITLVDTLALYGYSMALWVLAAILCVAPISGLQWLVCVVAGLWSSAYLLVNMWHVWKTRLEKCWFIGIVLLVFIFHMLITLSFKFYFLNYNLE